MTLRNNSGAYITLDVMHCPHCGQDHLGMMFQPVFNGAPTWQAMCYANGTPIFIVMVML